MTKPETCDRGVVCTPRTRCADHSNRDTVLAARQLRREQLAVLLSRAARGVLTKQEGPLLRAAVETELADANTAYLELDNQRETFDIAWEQQAADLERARRVAVALENDNARQEAELRDLRGALDWQTSCLTCARVLKSSYAETARAERAEQQLVAVRGLHSSSQETRGVGRGSPWRPYCDHCHQDWPCATIRALDGAQQPETDVVFEGPHTHAPQCGGCDRELSGQAYCRHNGDGIYGTWVAPDACACPQQPEPPREGSVR